MALLLHLPLGYLQPLHPAAGHHWAMVEAVSQVQGPLVVLLLAVLVLMLVVLVVTLSEHS